MSQFRIEHSYALDVLNFISVMTGNEFYTSRHQQAYAEWNERLSDRSKLTLAEAQADYGSHMLGPVLSLILSAVPVFDEYSLPALLADKEKLHHHFQGYPYYEAESWPQQTRLCSAIARVVAELEESGFRDYWESQRLPLIAEAEAQLTGYVHEANIDLPQLLSVMLDSFGTHDSEPIVVYVCSFAAPHGIKICGRRFISDVRYDLKNVLRIAVHEMFHPPYIETEVEAELTAIIGDPLFQTVFAAKDPIYGYGTEVGFLEENVVEAASLLVCQRAGIVADPVQYLVDREGGVYKVAVVLLAYFDRIAKAPHETFSQYFKRVVAQMPIGQLEHEYHTLMKDRA